MTLGKTCAETGNNIIKTVLMGHYYISITFNNYNFTGRTYFMTTLLQSV